MKKYILSLLFLVSLVNADFIRDDKKEIVIDTSTNLMWQDNNDSKIITKKWSDAIVYCENLNVGGYGDWHLPNINELFKLEDMSKYDPSVNSVFKNIGSFSYWSSTTVPGNSNGAYTAEFLHSRIVAYLKTSSYYVSCVRFAD